VRVTLVAPYDRTDLVDRFHRLGRVEESRFDERGTTLIGLLPSTMVAAFEPFVTVQEPVRALPEKKDAAPVTAA